MEALRSSLREMEVCECFCVSVPSPVFVLSLSLFPLMVSDPVRRCWPIISRYLSLPPPSSILSLSLPLFLSCSLSLSFVPPSPLAGTSQAELGPDDPNVQEIRKMLREYERQER